MYINIVYHVYSFVQFSGKVVSRFIKIHQEKYQNVNFLVWPSPSNQSFYRQIASYQRGVTVCVIIG